MSDPLFAAQLPSRRPPVRARATRWLDRLTGALLLGAAVSVAAAAAPAALRALGARSAPPQSAARMPQRSYTVPPSSRRFMSDRDDEEEDERLPGPRGAPGNEDPGAHVGDEVGLRAGLARKDLQVLGKPELNGAPVGAIKAGEMVTIVKESGDWALVVQSGADGVVMGWARRSEIVVR